MKAWSIVLLVLGAFCTLTLVISMYATSGQRTSLCGPETRILTASFENNYLGDSLVYGPDISVLRDSWVVDQ